MIRISGCRRMAFIFASIFIAGGVPFILNAQVNEDELKKAQGPVTFINYEGPYARIDTFAQIRTIGYSQGTAVKAGSVQSGASGRYFVIHSLTPPEGDRLDADIFGLGGRRRGGSYQEPQAHCAELPGRRLRLRLQ